MRRRPGRTQPVDRPVDSFTVTPPGDTQRVFHGPQTRPDFGPTDESYHHVGTGNTTSRYWCGICVGWYGVPHDNAHEKGRDHRRDHCVCGVCQKASGVWPSQGVFARHDDYLEQRAREDGHGLVH